MDTTAAAEYARLRSLQKGSEAEAAEFKKQADELEKNLLDAMIDSGTDSLTVNGQLIYMDTRVAANKNPEVDHDAYYAALRAVDLDDLIKPTVNASSIAAWVREQEDEGKTFPEDLPEPLVGVLNVHHLTSLRVKKAAGASSKRKPAARS